jgi:hypothetical protein
MSDMTSPVHSTSFQSLDEQLRFAMAHRRLIRFSYQGTHRVAEPHDYGIQKGITRLLTYQLSKAGVSPSAVRGWRLLDTSRMSDCAVLVRSFRGSRAQSRQHHYTWDVLYARVK